MQNSLRIVAAQINTTVGDIAGNTQKIIASAIEARDNLHADVIAFPEMTISGYPPEDLLLRQEIYTQTKAALTKIKNAVKNIYIIVGYPEQEKSARCNSAAVIFNKKIIANYRKQNLSNCSVFDEKRYFTAGKNTCIITIKQCKIALFICEDLWDSQVMLQVKKHLVHLAISLNASPFNFQKHSVRSKTLSAQARKGRMPVIYVNAIGAQDELLFDGGSMALNAHGKVAQRAPFFEETLLPVDIELQPKITIKPQRLPPPLFPEAIIYQALVLGVRDYVEKNKIKGVVIGLSGGIDSALTLVIAIDALGKDRVRTLFMPSLYTDPLSYTITEEQTKKLRVKYSVINIDKIFNCYINNLKNEFNELPDDITEENLQARCRGTLLMAMANKYKLIVLTTGNKSELAVGYATLYGDMAGGFCVLKDVTKTWVYRLANYRNNISPVIPQMAIDRAPSAELKYGQKDSDTLPPYPILDDILERYIEHKQTTQQIIAAGFAATTVNKVIAMINNSEYKRHQAPIGINITANAFGKDWKYPITKILKF